MESHYEALGLPPNADEAAIRRAHRERLKNTIPTTVALETDFCGSRLRTNTFW